jgi:PAS domain S-box-containing protein
MVSLDVELLPKSVDLTKETPIHVLHVDDEVDLLKSTKQILELHGPFQVETASSVKDAMQKIEKKAFDVVVSDYVMPERTGLDFLKELRERGNNIPFILFTGKGKEEVAINALNLGADYYANKIGDPRTVYGQLEHYINRAVEKRRAEIQLRKSEEKYRGIFENAHDVIALLDLKGNLTSVNKAAVEYGFKEEEVIGKNILNFVSKKYWPRLLKEVAHILQRNSVENKAEINTPKGKRMAEYRSSPIIVDNRVVGMQVILIDITERKKAGEKLQESEEKFRNLTENSPNMIFINKKGRVVYANKRCEDIMGYTREEFYSPDFNFFTLIAPEFIEVLKSIYSRHLKGKEILPYEYTLITKEGKRIEAILTSKLITYEGEKAILGIINDITERRQIELELKKSEEKYRMQFEEALDAIFLADAETGILVDCNRAATELVGRTKSEIIGKHQRILHPPEEIEGEFSRTFEKHLKEKEGQVLETQVITRTGEIRDVAIKASIFELGNKGVVQGVFRDITESKNMVEALRREREKLEMVTQNIGAGLTLISKDYHILWANNVVNDIFADAEGKICYETYHQQASVCSGCGVKEIFGGEKNLVVHQRMVKDVDGQNIWLENITTPIRDENGNITAALELSLDITERKQAEEHLKESEEKYRETTVNANVGIICYSPDGEVKIVNPKMEQMTGFKRTEIPTLRDWFEKLYPNEEERCQIRDNWFKRMSEEGEVKEGHAIITTKDGKRRNFLFNGVQLDSGDSIAFAEDITEHKEAEEKLDVMMNELVRINEKLGVVGKLTRHDARNKLSIIANSLYLAKMQLAENHKALEYLAPIESAIDQIDDIFSFTRSYEMLGIEELSYQDVTKCFDEAVAILDLNSVQLVNKCKGLSLFADSLLRQLFYNLMDNSLRHGETVTRIQISYKIDEKSLKLIYEDNGIGIPEVEKEKIFQKGYGKGTGLGLFLIEKMCEAYEWIIKETGTKGKGAQFTITIPTGMYVLH